MAVTFDELLAGLGARRSGDQHSACCPAHDDRRPSLSIAQRDGRLLLYCHAGCDFWAIVEALERRGLWPVQSEQLAAAVDPHDAEAKAAELYRRLRRINAEAEALDHTRADRYLTQRRITIRPPPQQLGYHPSLFHPWSRTTWPAMLGVVRDVDGHFAGFHRTWLSSAEPIDKAPVDPPRAMLGPLRGHAVQLSPPAARMVIGEGIETTLSAMQLYNMPGWAALTATNLKSIVLPPTVRSVVILADDDQAGLRGAIAGAQRLRREGREVAVIKPQSTNDFNDLLTGVQHER
jgi:putative DNA primase/helicase